jgi:16S rRNA (guanine(1405)-N(7))-methyltransferase
MDTLNPQVAQILEAILKKAKYRAIQPGLIESLAAEELAKGRKLKDAIKEVSSRLHQAGAAYLSSSPDYSAWKANLADLPHDLYSPLVKDFCRKHMQTHSSTQERLPIIEDFFNITLASAAPIESVLDLACGLNPLAIPWMPLAKNAQYSGSDIFSDMTNFLNQFTAHFGFGGTFNAGDITLHHFPQQAQVAFLLKTLPCLEQLDKGISPKLLDAVPADYLLISYPIRSLGGRTKGMGKTYEAQFEKLMAGRNWRVERFEFKTELAFLVKK